MRKFRIGGFVLAVLCGAVAFVVASSLNQLVEKMGLREKKVADSEEKGEHISETPLWDSLFVVSNQPPVEGFSKMSPRPVKPGNIPLLVSPLSIPVPVKSVPPDLASASIPLREIDVSKLDPSSWFALRTMTAADELVDPVIDQDKNRIRIILRIPGFRRRQNQIMRINYDRLDIAGWSEQEDPGKPVIPFKTITLTIPETAESDVQVESAETVRLTHLDLQPGQKPGAASVINVHPVAPDSRVYENDAYYPEDWILSTTTTTIRGKRMIFIDLTPLKYNPVDDSALLVKELVLVIPCRNDSVSAEKK